MKKRKKLIYLLSLIPGLGHFYLGLMNRGLQFMLLFCGTIFLTNIIESMGFFIPVIVFYSYFDALQFHNNYRVGADLQDAPLINNRLIRVNKSMVGWVLIAFGCLSVLENASNYLMIRYQISFDYDIFKNVLISAVFVVIGIKLLRGKSKEEI